MNRLLIIFLVFISFKAASQCDELVDTYYDSIVQKQVHAGVQHFSDPPMKVLIYESEDGDEIRLTVITAGLRSMKSDSVDVLLEFKSGPRWNRRRALLEEERVGTLYKYTAILFIKEEDMKLLAENEMKQFRIGPYFYFIHKDQSEYFHEVAKCLHQKFF